MSVSNFYQPVYSSYTSRPLSPQSVYITETPRPVRPQSASPSARQFAKVGGALGTGIALLNVLCSCILSKEGQKLLKEPPRLFSLATLGFATLIHVAMLGGIGALTGRLLHWLYRKAEKNKAP